MKYLALLCVPLYLLSGCKTSRIEEEKSGKEPETRTLDFQAETAESGVYIGFYNVENLFDTGDEPKKIDEDFLPSGRYNWTEDKYQRKLSQLASVVDELGVNGPDVLGLVEVENRKVVEDLAKTGRLSSRGYEVVHEESPDMRGIDVALIYDPDVFTYTRHTTCRINFPTDPDYTTRDVLIVEGTIDGEPLYLFVNHWPSRREGQRESEFRRIRAAIEVKEQIDSILAVQKDVNIILMGDFNDDPFNKSMATVLGGKKNISEVPDDGFYNPMYSLLDPDKQGTLTYQGKWNLFDQFLISEEILRDSNKLVYVEGSARIYSEGLNVGFGRGAENPRRAIFRGEFDPEGYSDHFPVYLQLRVN